MTCRAPHVVHSKSRLSTIACALGKACQRAVMIETRPEAINCRDESLEASILLAGWLNHCCTSSPSELQTINIEQYSFCAGMLSPSLAEIFIWSHEDLTCPNGKFAMGVNIGAWGSMPHRLCRDLKQLQCVAHAASRQSAYLPCVRVREADSCTVCHFVVWQQFRTQLSKSRVQSTLRI